MNRGIQFVAQLMPNVNTTLYTVPAGHYIDIRQVNAVSLGDADVRWWLYFDGLLFVPGTDPWVVPAGESISMEVWHVLDATETIAGYCDGAMNIFVSGLYADVT